MLVGREEATFIILILGGIGSWTTVVVVCTLWISSQLRKLEKVIYKETDRIEAIVGRTSRRVDRLELKVFGFSQPDTILPPRLEDSE